MQTRILETAYRSRSARRRCALGAALAASLTLTAAAPAQMDVKSTLRPVPAHLVTTDDAFTRALEPIVAHGLGLANAKVVALDGDLAVGAPLRIVMEHDTDELRLDLAPHSVRAPGYQLLVQQPDGSIEPAAPGRVRTLRGTVENEPGTVVTAAVLEQGLYASITYPDGERIWIEPISRILPGLDGHYVVYEDADVLPHSGACGIPEAANADFRQFVGKPEVASATAGSGICTAQLACDADTEYFNDYGSVANVEARINAVINTVNAQYEAQVSISHQITTILVRTGSDPYTSTDAQTRLCQFITEWTNNQGSIQRDVAHLFTGVNLSGTTIGIAADIGGTGVCFPNGACTGGTYGTQGSYCLAESDFNGSFGCATDLSAHELGHLWGAFHCNCSGATMNSSITCANTFSAGSINSISAYRDSRTCLDGACSGSPTGPPNDGCTNAEVVDCNASLTVSNATATPASGASDPELPAGSPSCQWQSIPSNTHNTLWYAFVADDTSIQIETCATTAIQDTIIALYGGSCGSLTELACGEDQCGSTTYMSSICYNGLTPGQTYLLMVGNPGGWSGSTPGTIELDLSCPCPSVGPVAGACCLSNGTCVGPVTPASCASQGGTFQGAGSDCGSVSCSTALGACCLPSGACANQVNAADCASAGGTYQGDGSDCGSVNCPQPTGACCLPSGSCLDGETAASCAGQGGTYQGNGTDCGSVSCAQPTGACCLPNGSCLDGETAASCAGQGGTYQGNGTDCGSVSCAQPTGACCLPNGSCLDGETAASCAGQGGAYQGNGSDCGSVSCQQPTGACCLPSGACLNGETAASCADQGGTYQGNASDCGSVNCPQPSGARLEAGSVSVGGSYTTVSLANSYTSAVVVCSVNYDNNTTPIVPRVRNVTSSSFQVRLQSPSGGVVAAETVNYIVVEEGVWTINGVDIEAVRYNSTLTDENNSWGAEIRSYGQSYSSPVVLGQVMTENDPDWSVFWNRGSNRQSPPNASNLRTGKTVCEDTDVTRSNETIGYIVIETGHGVIGGVEFEAALSSDVVRGIDNGPPFTGSFLTPFPVAPSIAVVTQAAMDGNNGGWAYTYGPTQATTTGLRLAVDEDQIRDSERKHTTEQVGYIAFESPVVVP